MDIAVSEDERSELVSFDQLRLQCMAELEEFLKGVRQANPADPRLVHPLADRLRLKVVEASYRYERTERLRAERAILP